MPPPRQVSGRLQQDAKNMNTHQTTSFTANIGFVSQRIFIVTTMLVFILSLSLARS